MDEAIEENARHSPVYVEYFPIEPNSNIARDEMPNWKGYSFTDPNYFAAPWSVFAWVFAVSACLVEILA